MDLFPEVFGYLFVLALALIVVGGFTNYWVGAYIKRESVRGIRHLTPASFLGLLVVRVILFSLMALSVFTLLGFVLASFSKVLDFFKEAEYLSAVVIVTGAGAACLVGKILTDWVEHPRTKYSILLLVVSIIMVIGMMFLSDKSRMFFESSSFGIRDATEWIFFVFVANVMLSILVYLVNRMYKAWFSQES